jgi:hypothetical protein
MAVAKKQLNRSITATNWGGVEVDLCLYYALKQNRFESITFHTAIKK